MGGKAEQSKQYPPDILWEVAEGQHAAGRQVPLPKPNTRRARMLTKWAKANIMIECKFNKTAKNVVHMTVRPQDIVDEEEEERKRAEGRQREEHEPTARCGCIIL